MDVKEWEERFLARLAQHGYSKEEAARTMSEQRPLLYTWAPEDAADLLVDTSENSSDI